MPTQKKRRIFEVMFPFAGLNRSTSFQHQPPYTTPDATNVRPFDTIDFRLRGGSRPGLNKAFVLQLGGGAPVRFMTSINVVGTSE
jgi:hypothetical protein